MILNALYGYYRRRAAAPDSDIPRLGFSVENIDAALVLDADGRVLRIVPLGSQKGKRRERRRLLVPREEGKRTSGIKAYFLWDKTDYLLGATRDAKGKDCPTPKHFAASRALHDGLLAGCTDPGAQAVLRFFAAWDPAAALALDCWPDIAGANLVFQLDGVPGCLCERPALAELWLNHIAADADAVTGQCLVTGERAVLAKLHPEIRGVSGAQTSGALLVSFNAESFCSYGRHKDDSGFNAPIGRHVAFGYAAALNELLRPDRRRRVQLGDATTVFWAERDSPGEDVFAFILAAPAAAPAEGAIDEQVTARVERALAALAEGRRPVDAVADLDPEVRFSVLGLAAPSGARLTVRFWHDGTIGEVLDRVGQHCRDLDLETRFDHERRQPPLWLLLRQTAARGDADTIPPRLAADVTRAVLTGADYPRTLLTALLERIRTEHGDRADPLNHARVALLKACLVRRFRHAGRQPMEVKVSLNREETNVAYRLGRLFAVLEKAQQDALGRDIGATIRDRYFGTASSAPRAAFPPLLRLAQHHIAKAEYGWRSDRLIAEIVDGIGRFPAHLTIEEQGLFAIGYYHQRNMLWRKTERPDADPSTTTQE